MSAMDEYRRAKMHDPLARRTIIPTNIPLQNYSQAGLQIQSVGNVMNAVKRHREMQKQKYVTEAEIVWARAAVSDIRLAMQQPSDNNKLKRTNITMESADGLVGSGDTEIDAITAKKMCDHSTKSVPKRYVNSDGSFRKLDDCLKQHFYDEYRFKNQPPSTSITVLPEQKVGKHPLLNETAVVKLRSPNIKLIPKQAVLQVFDNVPCVKTVLDVYHNHRFDEIYVSFLRSTWKIGLCHPAAVVNQTLLNLGFIPHHHDANMIQEKIVVKKKNASISSRDAISSRGHAKLVLPHSVTGKTVIIEDDDDLHFVSGKRVLNGRQAIKLYNQRLIAMDSNISSSSVHASNVNQQLDKHLTAKDARSLTLFDHAYALESSVVEVDSMKRRDKDVKAREDDIRDHYFMKSGHNEAADLVNDSLYWPTVLDTIADYSNDWTQIQSGKSYDTPLFLTELNNTRGKRGKGKVSSNTTAKKLKISDAFAEYKNKYEPMIDEKAATVRTVNKKRDYIKSCSWSLTKALG